jgi:hypothetical protein
LREACQRLERALPGQAQPAPTRGPLPWFRRQVAGAAASFSSIYVTSLDNFNEGTGRLDECFERRRTPDLSHERR